MDVVDEGGAVSSLSDDAFMPSFSTNWSAVELLLPLFVVEAAISIVTSSSSSSSPLPPLLVTFIREAAITSSSATTVVLFWNSSSSTWVDSSTTTLSSVQPSIFSISFSFVSLLSNNLTSSDPPEVPFIRSSGASFVAVDVKSSSSSHCSSSLLFVNVNLRNSFNSLDDSLDAACCCCCCCEECKLNLRGSFVGKGADLVSSFLDTNFNNLPSEEAACDEPLSMLLRVPRRLIVGCY